MSKTLMLLSFLLVLIANISQAQEIAVDDYIGTYQGRHKIWGKCFLEVKKENYEDRISFSLRKNSGKVFSSFTLPEKSLLYRLNESEGNFAVTVDTFRASMGTCLLVWWAGGCSNKWFTYDFQLDKNKKFKKVKFFYKKNKKITCRNLKKIN